MNKEVLETQWVQAKEYLRDKWSRLTDDDVRQINGRFDMLADKLQQRYGYSRERAEDEIRQWNMDRSARPNMSTSNRPYMRADDHTTRKDDSSSFYKWLLALAIPLILLATYFGATKSSDFTSTPTSSVQDMKITTQTPADQTLGQMIRQAMINNNIRLRDYSNISINASNGIVTVNGSVANAQERDAVSNIIRNISGVRQVNNRLEIRP